MRFNEKELQALSRQPAEMAAELGMRGPKKGSVVKRRLVKLVVNFLFYFRTDEAEPVGALLLEHCRVTQEEPSGFSISFLEDPERKYHFECCSEEQCQEWMAALRRARWDVGWSWGFGAEQVAVGSHHCLPQLRIHAKEPRLLQERDPEGDWQGPPGAVRHIGGGQVPVERPEGLSPGWGSSPFLLGPEQVPPPCWAMGFLARLQFAVGGVLT
uniref:Sesquipedalian n=1 Tax=Sus scrofa TaxID=9823 RepID=A0A4X1VNB7_PIG